MGNVGTGGGGGGGPPAGNAAPSPLDALASAIGVQGQTMRIPAVMRIPHRDVPVVVLILLGMATMFFGWRVLAFASVLHVASGLSEGGAGGGARGPAGGRPTGTPR